MLLALAASLVGVTHADTVFRCVGSDGVVAFQDQPCAPSEPQKVLHLRDVPPPPPTALPPPAPPSTPVVTAKPAAPRRAPPRARVPTLYSCTNAVNGDHYVSRNGRPQPYTAPLGMVDIAQRPLSQAFGAGSGSHLSAPETNRHPPNLGYGTAYSVWVQDRCRRLSRSEACAELQHQSDANDQKLKYAFGDDRGELQRRGDQLTKELAGCG